MWKLGKLNIDGIQQYKYLTAEIGTFDVSFIKLSISINKERPLKWS